MLEKLMDDYESGQEEHDWLKETGQIKLEQKNKKWYLVEDANNTAYSPYRRGKRVVEFVGDGNAIPTPREVTDYLKENPGSDCEWGGLYFDRWLTTDTDSKEVDLPAGCYTYHEAGGGIPERLQPKEIRSDDGVPLGDVFLEIENRIKTFLANREVYDKVKIPYKLGMLWHGPQGNGKTSLSRRLVHIVYPKDALIIFILDKFPTTDFLDKIRITLPDALKVFVFEELATSLNYWHIGKLLDFLDGESTVDNSIVVGTTNYPERIPGNIIDRPSRFDEVYYFGFPKDPERKAILEYYLSREVTAEEIASTKNLSIDDLKQASLLCKLHSMELTQSVKKMKDRRALAKKDFADDKTGVGF